MPLKVIESWDTNRILITLETLTNTMNMKIAIQLLLIRQYLELKMVEYFSDTH